MFDDNRPRGALWSWVEEEGKAHSGHANRLVLPLMDQAIRLRYPADELPSATSGVTLLDIEETDGWLVDQSTWTEQLVEIASYEGYDGDRSQAGWLLNEGMAKLYRAFSTYDKQASLTWGDGNQSEVRAADQLPLDVHVRVDTQALMGWSTIQLFDYDEYLAEVVSVDPSSSFADLHVMITRPGVHGLFALVTHADGVTMSTTDVLTYVVVPEPNMVLLLLALVASGLLLRFWRDRKTFAHCG